MSASGSAARFTAAQGPIVPLPRRQPASSARVRELEQQVATLRQDYAALHSALFEAAQVHRHLCAPRALHYGDFDVASEIFAVRQLPGDFFSAHEGTKGVVLALGDVCGKGLAAGMWVTQLAGLVTLHACSTMEPRAIVAGVNRDFRQTAAVPLASLFVARLDPETRSLDYCSAGHPPALLLRANGELEKLSTGGMLIGAVADASFEEARVQLRPGDALVAYSDGVLESRNHQGEEFGFERLERQMRAAEHRDAQSMLFSLLGAVQDFADGRPLEDDMSLVVVRRE